jgi:hypothetical protein
MKIKFKTLLLAVLTAFIAVGCSDDDDTKLPYYDVLPLSQGFDRKPDYNPILDNTLLEIPGWYNIAQTGTALWKVQVYQGNGYAELTTFQSNEPVNVSWLVSPEFTATTEHSTLAFRVAQSYVTNVNNKLEVFISEDFDGTNLTTATWIPLNPDLPGINATYFAFMDSGDISLAEYIGRPLHLAFKVTGSGTNANLDGSYQIDNVNVK